MRFLITALSAGLVLAGPALVQAQNSATITTSPGGVSGTVTTNKDGKPCRTVHSDNSTGSTSSSSTRHGRGW